MALLNAVRIAAKKQPAEYALIMFHGLGDTGIGISYFSQCLKQDPAFEKTAFVFPNAPTIPITVNNGYPMPAWYDLTSLGYEGVNADEKEYLDALRLVDTFIQEQVDMGIKQENIIVGGFSQGASLALGTSLVSRLKIGGIVALSGFILHPKALSQHKSAINQETPIFHGYGDMDSIVPPLVAEKTFHFVKEQCGRTNYNFKKYNSLAHGISDQEMTDLTAFIKKIWAI